MTEQGSWKGGMPIAGDLAVPLWLASRTKRDQSMMPPRFRDMMVD